MGDEAEALFIGAVTEVPAEDTFQSAADILNQPPEYFLIPDEDVKEGHD